MQAAENNIAQKVFDRLQVTTPKEIIKTELNAIATFTTFLEACNFAVALEQYSIPLAKMKGRRSFAGEAQCEISKESFNLLCNQLGLGDAAFDTLPINWQGVVQNQNSVLTCLS